MDGGNGHSSPPRIAGKPDRPPLTKKSKTSDHPQTPPHFPGPLFRAVRRLSPSSSFNSSSTTAARENSPSPSPVADGDAYSFNFSDRDYMFPSNLGPYSTPRNVNIKSSSKSRQKPQSMPQLPLRSASMPSSLSSTGAKGASGIGSPVSKGKLRVDKDLKALSVQVSASALPGLVASPFRVPAARDSTNFCRVQCNSSLGNSWKVNSLIFFCCILVSYAIHLQIEVTRLQIASSLALPIVLKAH